MQKGSKSTPEEAAVVETECQREENQSKLHDNASNLLEEDKQDIHNSRGGESSTGARVSSHQRQERHRQELEYPHQGLG